MTTIHTRQVVNKNAHMEKQHQVKKVLYIVSNIFFHHNAHTLSSFLLFHVGSFSALPVQLRHFSSPPSLPWLSTESLHPTSQLQCYWNVHCSHLLPLSVFPCHCVHIVMFFGLPGLHLVFVLYHGVVLGYDFPLPFSLFRTICLLIKYCACLYFPSSHFAHVNFLLFITLTHLLELHLSSNVSLQSCTTTLPFPPPRPNPSHQPYWLTPRYWDFSPPSPAPI